MHGLIFSAGNLKLLGVAVVMMVIGYIFLGQGPVYNPMSWTVAPIVLVGSYLVLFPLAILYKGKGEKNTDGDDKGV